jgi:hypothetical protein
MTAETIHTCSYSCDRPECIRAQRDELAGRLTTPPSAPVGVEGTWLWGKLMDWCREQRIAPATQDKLFAIAGEAHRLNALAQQPAAADGAYPTPRNRAEAVALARLALAYLGVIDAHIDVAISRCETDLATKHQEPTTCKHDFRRDEDHGGACCQLCGEVRQ